MPESIKGYDRWKLMTPEEDRARFGRRRRYDSDEAYDTWKDDLLTADPPEKPLEDN